MPSMVGVLIEEPLRNYVVKNEGNTSTNVSKDINVQVTITSPDAQDVTVMLDSDEINSVLTAATRPAFLRNVYLHFFIYILLTLGVIKVCQLMPSIHSPSSWVFMTVFGLCLIVAVYYLNSESCLQARKKFPINYIISGIYVGSYGYLIGSGPVFQRNWGYAALLVIFFGISATLLARWKKIKTDWIVKTLMIWSLLIVVLSIVSIFVHTSRIICLCFDVLLSLLYATYFFYNTHVLLISRIFPKPSSEENDYAVHTAAFLYYGMANMFLFIQFTFVVVLSMQIV